MKPEKNISQWYKEIEGIHGVGALELTKIFVKAFDEGMSQDIREGKNRQDESGDVARDAANRVALAMRKLLGESETVEYMLTTQEIYFLNESEKKVKFELDGPLADRVYEVMEIIHSRPPSQLKKVNGRYLARKRYNDSLAHLIRGIRYATESA